MERSSELPLRLHTPRKKLLLLVVASAGFVAIGIWMLPEHPVMAVITIVFFGLATIVTLVGLLPGTSWLELSDNGFTFCSAFRQHFTAWKDVSQFEVVTIGNNRMVGWRFAPNYRPLATGRLLSNLLAGTEAALPSSYGMGVQPLTDLLNKRLDAWRQTNGFEPTH